MDQARHQRERGRLLQRLQSKTSPDTFDKNPTSSQVCLSFAQRFKEPHLQDCIEVFQDLLAVLWECGAEGEGLLVWGIKTHMTLSMITLVEVASTATSSPNNSGGPAVACLRVFTARAVAEAEL